LKICIVFAARARGDLDAIICEKGVLMKFSEKIKEAGATGYILLWLLGIPIPILLIIFLLRGCT
jgi:hypothetical protein